MVIPTAKRAVPERPSMVPVKVSAPARLSWVGGEVIRERTPLCS
jgi:hypothetical protein